MQSLSDTWVVNPAAKHCWNKASAGCSSGIPPTLLSTLLSSLSLQTAWSWEGGRAGRVLQRPVGFPPLWPLTNTHPRLCQVTGSIVLLFKPLSVDFLAEPSFQRSRGNPREAADEQGMKDRAVSQAYPGKAPPLITLHYNCRAAEAAWRGN